MLPINYIPSGSVNGLGKSPYPSEPWGQQPGNAGEQTPQGQSGQQGQSGLPAPWDMNLPPGSVTDRIMQAAIALRASSAASQRAGVAQQVRGAQANNASNQAIAQQQMLANASTSAQQGQNAKELFKKEVMRRFSNDVDEAVRQTMVHEKTWNMEYDMLKNQFANLQSLTKKAADSMRVA